MELHPPVAQAEKSRCRSQEIRKSIEQDVARPEAG